MIPTNYDNDDEEDDMTGFEVENDPSLTYAMQIGTIENDSSFFSWQSRWRRGKPAGNIENLEHRAI